MAVFKRKTHTISIRVSEEEFQSLQQASITRGARSISDYARDTLFHSLSASSSADGLEGKINWLASELESLNQVVERLREAVGQNESQITSR